MKNLVIALALASCGCSSLSTIRIRTSESGTLVVKVPLKRTRPSIDIIAEFKAGFNPNNSPLPTPDRGTMLIKVKW